jgi:myo-inositol 2-dehydrogenase/D-chiro-inositol 1-dehydrogenase
LKRTGDFADVAIAVPHRRLLGSLIVGEHRVALVGAGRIARLHAENVAAQVHRLRLVAIADPAAGVASALAAEFGGAALDDWRELLERDDVDALLLCSPSRLHPEQIAAAAEAGKHVFCEKPIAADVAAADRAVAAADAAGIVLQVGYNRRFDRSFAALREAVAGGRVGKPVIVRVTARDPEPPVRSYLEHTPGLFVDTTSHDLDLIRFVTRAEIVEVGARAASLVSEDARELGLVDTAVTTVVLDSGALGSIDDCWRSSYGYDQRLEVHGTEGMVEARNEVQNATVVADATGFHAPTLPYFFLERYAAAFVRELEAFADALEGAPVAVTGRDGRQALAAALAAVRSAEERRVVRLDET